MRESFQATLKAKKQIPKVGISFNVMEQKRKRNNQVMGNTLSKGELDNEMKMEKWLGHSM